MTSDIVIADRQDASQAFELHLSSLKDGRSKIGIDVKGTDPNNLGTLWAIISGTEDDLDFFTKHRCDELCDGEESLVFQVPPELALALSGLDQAGVKRFGQRWAESGELEDWEHDEVVQRLQELHEIARDAAKAGKSLFLSWSV